MPAMNGIGDPVDGCSTNIDGTHKYRATVNKKQKWMILIDFRETCAAFT